MRHRDLWVVLQGAEILRAERGVRVGRGQEVTRSADCRLAPAYVRGRVRLVQRGDQARQLLEPAESQIVRCGLQELAGTHATTEPLGSDPLGLEQTSVQLEKRLANGRDVGHICSARRAMRRLRRLTVTRVRLSPRAPRR